MSPHVAVNVFALVFLCTCNIGVYSFTDITQDGPPIICQNKVDGIYVLDSNACSQNFYKCANNKHYQYKCPSGLFFNFEEAQCDYKNEILACGGTPKKSVPDSAPKSRDMLPTLVAPAVPTQRIQPIYPISAKSNTQSMGQFQRSAFQPQNPTASIVGQQSISDASPQLVVKKPISSPSSQQNTEYILNAPYKNQYKQQQQQKWTSTALPTTYQQQQQQKQPQPVFAYPPSKMAYAQTVSQASESEAPPMAVANVVSSPLIAGYDQKIQKNEFDCTSMSNGYYEKKPCDIKFYLCSAGITTKIDCPTNLLFDIKQQTCVYPSQCGNSQQPMINSHMPSYNKKQSTQCEGKADGLYELGKCQSVYLQCANNIAHQMSCQQGLVFKKNQCVQQQDCLNPIVASTVTSQSYTTNQISQTWCQINNKPDGFYSIGCSSTFTACNSKHTFTFQCPNNLIFDVITNSCNYEKNVEACSGNSPVSTTTTIASPIVNTESNFHYNCDGKSDGFYGQGCNNFYFMCLNSAATKVDCPGNFYYNEQVHQCDFKHNISECGGQLPTNTTPTITTTITTPTYSVDWTSSNTEATTDQSNQFEMVNPDSQTPQPESLITADDISPNHNTEQTSNPENKVTQSSITDQPEVTSDANYNQPSEPTPTVTTTEVPYGPDDGNPCDLLRDGIYGRPCSRHYFVCSVKKTYEFTCPSQYAYDRQLARCGHISGITGCTSASQA